MERNRAGAMVEEATGGWGGSGVNTATKLSQNSLWAKLKFVL